MSNVILVVKVKVKEEFATEVYTFMKALHKLTHELDEGCIQYDLHKVLEDENTFCFIETWENEAFLIEHSKKDHFINFMEYVEGKIEDMQKTFLEKYEEKN
ncbi:MAG: antibiotic biosynthesis monooxygenase [Arcobacter sp.]|nr:MAG: antibiotic biosynthesis monooxygenase [Arcobacter sp.]